MPSSLLAAGMFGQVVALRWTGRGRSDNARRCRPDADAANAGPLVPRNAPEFGCSWERRRLCATGQRLVRNHGRRQYTASVVQTSRPFAIEMPDASHALCEVVLRADMGAVSRRILERNCTRRVRGGFDIRGYGITVPDRESWPSATLYFTCATALHGSNSHQQSVE